MDFTSIIEQVNNFWSYLAIIPFLVAAYSFGFVMASHNVRRVINRARRAGGVNFGEAAAIEITSMTTTSMWMYSLIIIAGIGVTVLLLWVGVTYA